MIKWSLPTRLLAQVLSITGVSIFLSLLPSLVYSAPSSHVVISEIQIAGSNVDDEFVELYNPTGEAVNVTGWRLTRRTANQTVDTNNLVASMSGTIPAYGYFLIAPEPYSATISADISYSTATRLADDNSVLLYKDNGDGTRTLVDLVGMGEAVTNEASAAGVPEAGQSIERKALFDSTGALMLTDHANQGNGEDTDNNNLDFLVREVPDPQNATASPEPLTLSPSPTATPSASPTESPTEEPSPSLSPTLEPTVTPSPTEEPTPTATPNPTDEPSPTPSPSASSTPTASPTSTPTEEPTPIASPTVEPSESPTPVASPTSTPKILVRWSFPFSTRSCRLENTRITFGFMRLSIPRLVCN